MAKINGVRARLAAILAVVAIALFATAPAALAQSSSVDTYGGTGGEVVTRVNDPGSGSASSRGGDPGSLPFTGFDLGLAAGGGLLLLGAGVALSRAVQSRPATGRRSS